MKKKLPTQQLFDMHDYLSKHEYEELVHGIPIKKCKCGGLIFARNIDGANEEMSKCWINERPANWAHVFHNDILVSAIDLHFKLKGIYDRSKDWHKDSFKNNKKTPYKYNQTNK